MMLSDSSSSSSDSDYDTSSTLDLADQITILLNEGINDGPGPKKPPIVIDPRMLSRRSGRLEGIIKSPPLKTKNLLLKNQVLAAKNQMMAKNMQPNKYGRKSTTADNILTFNAADKLRVLNILPKDDVKADDSKKKVSVTIDNYARRTLNMPNQPKDDVRAAESKRKISVSGEGNRRSVKPVLRSAVQR